MNSPEEREFIVKYKIFMLNHAVNRGIRGEVVVNLILEMLAYFVVHNSMDPDDAVKAIVDGINEKCEDIRILDQVDEIVEGGA